MSTQLEADERSRPPAGDDAREGLLARTLVMEPRGGHPMSSTRRARFRAAIVAIAPAVLLAGFVSHPYIGVGPHDDAAIAAAVAADTTRWGLVHLTVGVASGFLVLAFLAIRSYLREEGEERWSALALPFILIGSTLFALLPGMEFAPLAAAETGGDVRRPRLRCFRSSSPSLRAEATQEQVQ